MTLPRVVSDYLQHLMAGVFEPAFILIDAEEAIADLGGALSRYGLGDISVGQPIGDRLWFLAGVLPVDPGEPLVLPSVSVREGSPTHIHLIPTVEGTWVLLVDAGGDDAQQQIVKQAFNQLDLERQRRTSPTAEEAARTNGLDDGVYAAALGALGGVLLERLAGSRFTAIGSIPAWFSILFPTHNTEIDVGASLFLADFLEQANGVWSDGTTDRLESGLWTEATPQGGEEHLGAIALAPTGRSILLIRRRTRQHDEQQRMLQSARDRRLRYDRLVKQTQNNEILVHCIIHDLNGPLTGLMGCLDLLDLQDLTPKAKDLVQLAIRQALAQKAMIRGILDAFSAEVESLHHIERDPTFAPNLLDTARSAVENFTPVAKTHEVGLELVAPPNQDSSWRVVGEESRLTRILANLMDNALRHSPPGSVVKIRLRREGASIFCDVEDQGKGVPEALADTLFDKLTKTADGGGKAGLGLYFCRITVERWGGEIGYRARPEGGTSFWFRLDAADASTIPPSRIDDFLCGAKVLLIEDDDVNRHLVREILGAAGVAVAEAADGETALKMAADHSFDAILLDIHLPGMSGFDIAGHLRERSPANGEIIAMTADVFVTESDHRGEFDGVIQKPFSSKQLKSALAQCLRSRSAEPGRADDVEGSPSGDQPNRLPGINIEDTLERIGGDAQLLWRMLARFDERCRDAVHELGDLVGRGDTEGALRLAHSLKGTGANLGAEGVAKSAQEIEVDLRSEAPDPKEMIEKLAAAVDELSSSLRRLGMIEEEP